MTLIQLLLVDPQKALCQAFTNAFRGLPNVTIVHGYFERLPSFDCMVSAANSFGLMDGGVDAAIINFFGDALMLRVQERIVSEYLGEQPVGTAMIVETGHDKHPYIAHTPTMRIPMTIAHTEQVYTAMWALLVAVYQHNQTAARPIQTLACPGLGTATGRVPYAEAARQMAVAWQRFHTRPTRISWEYAQERHWDIQRRSRAIDESDG